MAKLTIGFTLITLLITESMGLRGVRISVPSAVNRGEDATLECVYDLEQDELYSVKWYKGTTEFFRYTPSEKPKCKQFRDLNSGLIVREKDSGATRVVLENVPRSASGRYSCEVTAEQPSFFTYVQSAILQVVDVPKDGPFIYGLKPRYRLDETLKANCTSGKSNPPTNLTWYINGIQVEHVHKHKFRHSSNGFYTTTSALRKLITKDLFERGSLKVRCVASMYDIYYQSNEKSVEWENKERRHHHNNYRIIPTTHLFLITTATTTTEYPPSFELSHQAAAERYPETTLTLHINNNGANRFHKILFIITAFINCLLLFIR